MPSKLENNFSPLQKTLSALSWTGPEYDEIPRSSDWYWSVWIISISLAVTAIILKNTLLGILILLGTLSVTLFSVRKPTIIKFKIDQNGIAIGDRLYPYSTLESFAIEDIPGPVTKLVIKSQKKFLPYIVVPILDETREEVRFLLSGFLEESDHRESVFIKLLNYLGL